MNSVSINIVVNEDYYHTRYVIENLLHKTNLKPVLNICNTNTSDDRIKSFCEEICKDFEGLYVEMKSVSLTDAYNYLLERNNTNYSCIFPLNLLVNKFWLEDLIFNYENCSDNPGVLSIKNGNEKLKLFPLLYKNHNYTEDELYNVWIGDLAVVEGLMFFETNKLKKTDLLLHNDNLSGHLFQEFCFRFALNDFRCFYIRKQSVFKINTDNEYLFPKKTIKSFTIFKEIIEELVKEKRNERTD